VIPALELVGVGHRYGSLAALDDVSFTVPAGARHAVIGPNGAGKSTLFAAIAGTLRARSGRIVLHGRDVTRRSEAARCRLGLVRTFQHSSVFLEQTVLDNVALAEQRASGVALRPLRAARRYRAVSDAALEQIDAVGLAGRSCMPAAALSHGERRQLEVAMVLATRPDVVLFDEPTAGMSPAETRAFAELVAGLPPQLTVLIIEHDLDVVFGLSSAVTVLHLGRVLATGSPAEIQSDAAVQEAYLGTGTQDELFFAEEPT
jgi:branched-chain amino acid transport system ATP-binding protein